MMSSAPLQVLAWPEIGLNTERDLYCRLDGGAALSMEARKLVFIPGGTARFNTYHNLFNIGKWHKYCALNDISLSLYGSGTFELVVHLLYPDHSSERLHNEVITLEEGAEQSFALQADQGFRNRGLLFFELHALSEGYLQDAQWHTDQSPQRVPELMLSITTFRREEAVQSTVDRFERFIGTSPLKDHIHLTVVDNGQSAELTASSHVTPIPNENLGGAGGFTRGLLAAQARGASHCLFMDDDASIHMEAVERTWMFLAYATDDRVAVAGALMNAQHRWKMWENGARFSYLCHPQFINLDLRQFDLVTQMEFDSTADKPDNFYGGWWYFAFPVQHVDYLPFPFFVRGDDVSFSLLNHFNTVTLPGVICFQNEDFSSKESPQTLYLDLRGHLAHHLVAPQLDIDRKGLMKILAWFFVRSFLSCHYETLAALNLSLRDAIEGPEFFRKNADMSQRRNDIKELMNLETWKDLEGEPPIQRHRFDPNRRLHRVLMKMTLNGHLLPFFARFGNHIVLPADMRGHRRSIWGAVQITYVSSDRKKAYTVEHNKTRAWSELRHYIRASLYLWRNYDKIQDDWRRGYADLTTGTFWPDVLKIDAQDSGIK